MKIVIKTIHAMEILDSRGNPTVKAMITLSNGITASASCPSGASTGEKEALELRDGDKTRYGGKGVLKAVANILEKIDPLLRGRDPSQQAEIDKLMIELDGTGDKSKLGANAIVAVSMAAARAASMAAKTPLYAYLADTKPGVMPVPMMNVINGGKHARNSIDFQEFMIMPVGAPSFVEALRCGAETFHALSAILSKHGYATGVGDEGGFAPNLKSNDEACDMIIDAICAAGFKPGQDIAIALDPAASSFYENGFYHLAKSGQGKKTSEDMINLYGNWIKKYPLVSIEDGLAENDWAGFQKQTAKQGSGIQIVGDDIFVTNPGHIALGVSEKTANAVLIKLNQIGTVTETIEAIRICRKAGWKYVISHRSGETEDTFIADFAVAMGAGQIKAGSPCRSERTAKYNRLLEIEAELGRRARFTNPFKSKKM